MTEEDRPAAPPPSPKPEAGRAMPVQPAAGREARRAVALRENLRRRKAQARARAEAGATAPTPPHQDKP